MVFEVCERKIEIFTFRFARIQVVGLGNAFNTFNIKEGKVDRVAANGRSFLRNAVGRIRVRVVSIVSTFVLPP